MANLLIQPDPSIERQKRLAEIMMARGQRDGPVRHWTEGLSRALDQGLGAYAGQQASSEEELRRKNAMEKLSSVLSGNNKGAQQLNKGLPEGMEYDLGQPTGSKYEQLQQVLAGGEFNPSLALQMEMDQQGRKQDRQDMVAKARLEQQLAQSSGPAIGKYNPRDYTVDSFAKFRETGDPSTLERYESQRTVDIGGVPHVFDPSRGGYYPARVGGTRGGRGTPSRGALGNAQGETITAETVGQNAGRIKQMEAESTPPEGYRFNEDGRLIPQEGGPKARELQQTKKAARQTLERKVPGILRDVNRVLGEAHNAGPVAGAFADPGTDAGRISRATSSLSPAFELKQHLDSIKSNISIDELQSMREASPTGGALGQVPVRQQEFLMQVQGALLPTLDEDILKENVKRVHNNYLDLYLDALYGDELEWQEAIEDGRATEAEMNTSLREKQQMKRQYMKETEFGEFGQPTGGQNETREGRSVDDLPPTNDQGWQLMEDASGNKAYVGPNGEIEEVQ